jgi:hypothetical protein
LDHFEGEHHPHVSGKAYNDVANIPGKGLFPMDAGTFRRTIYPTGGTVGRRNARSPNPRAGVGRELALESAQASEEVDQCAERFFSLVSH